MASPWPVACLRTLQRQCLSQRPFPPSHKSLPIRQFSSTSQLSWQRAVRPPKEYITYEQYTAMMAKPAEQAQRLAMHPPLPPSPTSTPDPTSESTPDLEVSGPETTKTIEQDPARARLVPASPSYFSVTPRTMDDVVHLAGLLRRNGSLPKLPKEYTPKVVWKSANEYNMWVGEAVPVSRYTRIKSMLTRLNMIMPELRRQEVTDAINAHLKDPEIPVQPREPPAIDEWGRGFGAGRRKTARAMAYVVEGSGDVLVNERKITDVFGRVRDRESALWPLTATGRMSRYNVFAVVKGGGTTGWAEAMALAVAKAVLVHEPGLKTAMRRAGVIRRDPRMVERKKPGHTKARKMPRWVKR